MNKQKIISLSALAAYSAAVLIMTLNHEYWFDEAQAWNIARDNDIAGIIAMMRYEGHPPLWHFILKIFISLGCSWRALGLVSWGVSTITAALIIFALPAKPYLKAALLLSSGMLYVNSVISRVYCLINLLVIVIAVLYPKRKKHPLLFGLAVALLADTHICMCGLVGIIGIFMLVDYFKDFKTNSRRENIFNTFGLLIAGLGVLALILPLLGSFGANNYAAEKTFSFKGVLLDILTAPAELIKSACAPNFPDFIGAIFSVPALAALVAVFILLRKKRGTFAIAAVFTAFYIAVVGVIWYSTPNRGAVFIYTLTAIFIMGSGEAPAASDVKIKTPDSRVLRAFGKLDKNTEFSLSVILAGTLALSIPSGVKYAVGDLFGEFSPSKAAAEFIRENIPENALLATYDEDCAALLTYLPERKIFSLDYDRFYTYCSHEILPDTVTNEKLAEISRSYDEIYFIHRSGVPLSGGSIVYRNENSIPFVLSSEKVVIYKMTRADILSLVQ